MELLNFGNQMRTVAVGMPSLRPCPMLGVFATNKGGSLPFSKVWEMDSISCGKMLVFFMAIFADFLLYSPYAPLYRHIPPL